MQSPPVDSPEQVGIPPNQWVPKSQQVLSGIGKVDDHATRPERRGERRRLLISVGILIVLIACCSWEFNAIRNPTEGFQNIIAAGAAAPSPTTKSLLGSVVSAGPATPAPPLASSSGVARCRAKWDLIGPDYLIPTLSMVRVNGFSRANGGLAYVMDPAIGWISSDSLDCEFDLGPLEKVYSATMVPSVTPSVMAKSAAPIVRVVRQTVVVPQTVVVQQLVTNTQSVDPSMNGIWFDGSCWHFSAWGVKAVYADNDPIAGGSVYCKSPALIRIYLR